ncbi:hypothetical protein [Serratia fonticola]
MKFQDLPPEVQVVAAQTLPGKLCQSGFSVISKTEPAKELAREVKAAFIELYSELVSTHQQSDPKEA